MVVLSSRYHCGCRYNESRPRLTRLDRASISVTIHKDELFKRQCKQPPNPQPHRLALACNYISGSGGATRRRPHRRTRRKEATISAHFLTRCADPCALSHRPAIALSMQPRGSQHRCSLLAAAAAAISPAPGKIAVGRGKGGNLSHCPLSSHLPICHEARRGEVATVDCPKHVICDLLRVMVSTSGRCCP